MLYKRVITPLKQYLFEWRGLGVGKWVPILVLYLIIPVMNLLQYHKYGQGEMFLTQIYITAFMLLPILSPFYVVFVFQEYYETADSPRVGTAIRAAKISVCSRMARHSLACPNTAISSLGAQDASSK